MERMRQQLSRSLGSKLGSVVSDSSWAEVIQDISIVGPGSVLLADPRQFARACDRAGAGTLGMMEGATGLALKAASMFGIGAMDVVADGLDWKRGRLLPVVLVLERNEDGSGEGVALTVRTGSLLGDFDFADGFMTRPVHWGGPEKADLFLVHPHTTVSGAKPLGGSGLCEGGKLEAAQACVNNGQGSSLSFRFFIGKVRWGRGELDGELSSGTWFPVRCSQGFVLDESESVRDQPLWAKLATAAGGEVLDLARKFDLL